MLFKATSTRYHTMPQLRVSCGPSRDKLTVVPVNYDVSCPVDVSSDHFEGQIMIRIRDFSGDVGSGKTRLATTESDYFEQHPRLSWSMAIQGRFKHEVNANDVLYGNIFDKPIKDRLPYGTAAALRFIHFVDPALEQDIYGDKPWALSPMIATMNFMQVSATEADSDKKVAWSSTQPDEDTSVLSNDKEDAALSNLKGNADGRRAHFAKEENRKAVTIKPNHWFNMDFCNGYMDFNTLSLKLPGGLSFSLMRYWDGQPVTYVCKSRDSSKEYFFIVFDIIDEGPAVAKADKEEEEEETNPDLD